MLLSKVVNLAIDILIEINWVRVGIDRVRSDTGIHVSHIIWLQTGTYQTCWYLLWQWGIRHSPCIKVRRDQRLTVLIRSLQHWPQIYQTIKQKDEEQQSFENKYISVFLLPLSSVSIEMSLAHVSQFWMGHLASMHSLRVWCMKFSKLW